jgi:hypothetical protein
MINTENITGRQILLFYSIQYKPFENNLRLVQS